MSGLNHHRLRALSLPKQINWEIEPWPPFRGRQDARPRLLAALLAVAILAAGWVDAAPLSIVITNPAPPGNGDFKMGESRRPDGATITLDNYSLRLNGQPWMPVMGEFHYARYPESEWREELLKMKAGGIDAVATYVFWIHHEEVEGHWDWTGRRNLRAFIQLCGELGLKAVVRCGPWDHGEVRNGGLPDWILNDRGTPRTTDPVFLEQVKFLYQQIARQLNGLLWKDGGPVIGIQLDNEYRGPAEYLLALKKIARDAGMDVPLYTKTGWPALTTPLPYGEIIPLYGVYAEGFWDRVLTPMPDGYWRGFQFSRLRTDDAIGSDILKRNDATDPPGSEDYPYLTCEIGAGMMPSYHRRIVVYPEDSLATTMVKLGSGGASLGYYMFHGGENPDGKLTTLMESQATGYWNDMPVKNYDFQTALGQYGQIRPQYHLLRRLHLFLHEWGSKLADMPASMPVERPRAKDDFDTLRWCVRSDGATGFVFVNNYQRLQELPPKTNVQFALQLPAGTMTFPAAPVTVPAGACFFWPFNFDLGHGARLAWATAQPITAIDDGNLRTLFFAETKGVPAEFAFEGKSVVKTSSGKKRFEGGRTILRGVQPGPGFLAAIRGTDGATLQIVLLSDADSLALWKGNWQGRGRVFLTRAGLVLDGDHLRLASTDRATLKLAVYPTPGAVECAGKSLHSTRLGIFAQFTPSEPPTADAKVSSTLIRKAGPPRTIPMGRIQESMAAEPEDADFAQAAVWRIKLPADLDLGDDPILRLHYVGDVARVTLNGKLLTDNFYNGMAFDVGLRRYAPEVLTGDLQVEILPVHKNAPIMLAKEAQPDFGAAASVAKLDRSEIVVTYGTELGGR